jgi:deazaflavin-dependent oxidoreductase (nitroreductase family)
MTAYLRPPWMQRFVGNRIAPLFQPSLLSKLSVPGRRTGQWHTTPVAVLDYEGARYLVSYRGESNWARNLRASGHGRLLHKGQVEEFTATEVPVAERAPLLQAYSERFGKMPTVGRVLRALPDPADHPTFRIGPPTA